MQDRAYHELKWITPFRSNPAEQHEEEAKQAVKLAHEEEINQIKRYLMQRQSVLIIGDKSLAPYLEACLQEQPNGMRLDYVIYNLGGQSGSNRQMPTGVSSRLVYQLPARLQAASTADPPPVVVIRHLDLMTWTASDNARGELNDVVYWLTEFSNVVKLAFWDPVYSLPKVIEDLFPNHISMQIFNREVLWKLVSQEEAKKISPSAENFTLAAQLTLYQYLSGINVVDVRRILRGINEKKFPDCHDAHDAFRVFQFIRERSAIHAELPPEEEGQIAGYENVQQELTRKVLFPVRLRHEAKEEISLKQADVLIPRGILLYGPPGTGKTEWSKWLARELGATLQIIHGPELKHRLVGETEAEIRRIFARARRSAPAIILIDEIDAMTPTRDTSQSNFEASMVAQFLTEMDGLHKDEAVLVIGTTNRLEAVDIAFKRPGRFGVQIEIGYPDENDRREILEYYNNKFVLGLNEKSIELLVRETAKELDPEYRRAWQSYHDAYIQHRVDKTFYETGGPALKQQLARQFNLTKILHFSGDHLRAICLYLLRESLYRSKNEPHKICDVNNCEFLLEAVTTIRKQEKTLTQKNNGSSHIIIANDERFSL